MNYYQRPIKPYKNRTDSSAISIYLTSDDAPALDSLNCIWCKRTVADVKGKVDTIIGTPMPLQDFDIAVNIRCKLCHQDYRLLVRSEYIQG